MNKSSNFSYRKREIQTTRFGQALMEKVGPKTDFKVGRSWMCVKYFEK